MKTITCAGCKTATDKLEIYPGKLCFNCWKTTPAGQKMPTAEELIAMWGGKA